MTWRNRSDMGHVKTAIIIGLIVLAIYLMFFFYEPSEEVKTTLPETPAGYDIMPQGIKI